MSGAEGTVRALSKVSTNGLDLMGGGALIWPHPSNSFMTLIIYNKFFYPAEFVLDHPSL